MPVPSEITEAELSAMLARAGVVLSADTRAELLTVLPALDAMRALIRTPATLPAAEPALVFVPDSTP